MQKIQKTIDDGVVDLSIVSQDLLDINLTSGMAYQIKEIMDRLNQTFKIDEGLKKEESEKPADFS